MGALVVGYDGALYGTTAGGGQYGDGTVFRKQTSGTNYSILHSFGNPAPILLHYGAADTYDGGWPQAALLSAPDGNLYGTTQYGGSSPAGSGDSGPNGAPPGGQGTVFGISMNGDYSVLHAIGDGTATRPDGTDNGHDGANPVSGLTVGPGGYLYGVLPNSPGQMNHYGIVYMYDNLPALRGYYYDTNPSLFTSGSDAGWYGSSQFGYYRYVPYWYPWIYQQAFGWTYVADYLNPNPNSAFTTYRDDFLYLWIAAANPPPPTGPDTWSAPDLGWLFTDFLLWTPRSTPNCFVWNPPNYGDELEYQGFSGSNATIFSFSGPNATIFKDLNAGGLLLDYSK